MPRDIDETLAFSAGLLILEAAIEAAASEVQGAAVLRAQHALENLAGLRLGSNDGSPQESAKATGGGTRQEGNKTG
jgi:hypothetical protein